MNIGILVEFNPLHNGHLKIIDYIKNKHPGATIIVISSGDLVIRGGISIYSKFDRAEMAIKNGVDAFFTLNPEASINTANEFAKQGLKHFSELKIDKIFFGSEIGNTKKIEEDAKLLIKNDSRIKKYIKENKSSLPNAISAVTGINSSPNDILAMCYIKEIITNNYQIKYESLKRVHSNNLTSASNIRTAIYKDENLKKFSPIKFNNYIHRDIDIFTDIFKYKIQSNYKINESDESEVSKISNFFSKKKFSSINQLVIDNSTKNFTSAKLRRTATKILFDLDEADRSYVRLLASTKKGFDYLNKIDSSKYHSKFNIDVMQSDIRVAKIIDIKYPGTLEKEFSNKIIIK